MTVFLRDASDYDSLITDFSGLAGFTHKATEGITITHVQYRAQIAAAKSAGVPVLGSYHVVRTPNSVNGTLAQQLAFWVSYQDTWTPWWRTWPHWVMQIDAEKWPYDPVSATTVLQFAAMLTSSGLPGWKVTYASRGQFGDTLRGITTPLWNADYRGGSNYAGDNWTSVQGPSGILPAGWAPYSDQTPVLLQYTGGPDLNAYRGSLADLLNLTGGTVALTQEDCANVARLVLEGVMWDGHLSDPGADAYFAKLNIKALLAGVAAPAVDTHALATELVTELEAAGILTADGAHEVVKAVLDAKLAAAQAA